MDLLRVKSLVPKYQTRYSSLIKYKYDTTLGKQNENPEDIIRKDIYDVINDR